MPSKESWTYERIRQLHLKEKVSKAPTRFTKGLYDDMMKFFNEINEQYQGARQEDPEAQETLLLEEEYYKVRRIIKQLFECRERKILLMALSRAKGENVDLGDLTPDEESLFDGLMVQLERHRRETFYNHIPCNNMKKMPYKRTPSVVKEVAREEEADEARGGGGGRTTTEEAAGIGTSAVDAPGGAPGGAPGTSPDAGPACKGAGIGGAGSPPDPRKPCAYVPARILTDIATFTATDMRTYTLKKEDIVSLPRDTAAVLTARGKAELIGPDMGCRL